MTRRSSIVFICAVLMAFASASAIAAPTKKHSGPATKGTSQMPGGSGLFGQTYTLVSSDGFGPINFTLVSAKYSVTRVDMSRSDSYAPKVGEKLLVIHYRLKNPNKSDLYYSSRHLFQAVDANDNTIEDSGDSRRESEKAEIGTEIKPGQGIDDLFTYIVVPAQGAIPKLILQLGRPGTTDLVTRYKLGTAPNIVKPIPAPYADSTDPTGATPLAVVSATVGTTYAAGYFDLTVTSLALAPGPFGQHTADAGNQFLVATVTMTNKTFAATYFNSQFTLALKTDDDKITRFDSLKADHDDDFPGVSPDPDETVTERLIVQVPKDAKLKTLSLAENVDNTGGVSKAFLYDLSNVK